MKTEDKKAIFEFSPESYFLVYATDDRFGTDSHMKVWSLNYKVDRADAGRDPDVGISVIYLSEEEAEKLKPHFDWLNL